MEKIYDLTKLHNQTELWTRQKAAEIRSDALDLTSDFAEGDVLVLDASNVEVFDFSFAAELFGELAKQFQIRDGQFFVVDEMDDYNQGNLQQALSSIGRTVVMRNEGRPWLLGAAADVDKETFAAVASADPSITAHEIQQRLGIALNATNERLKKLLALNLIRRVEQRSPAGRKQFAYRTLA
jgi:hypothetical protein